MFNLDKFIADSVTYRPESMFKGDIEANKEKLTAEIKGKKVCVIGGAGSIDSSFSKVVLHFVVTGTCSLFSFRSSVATLDGLGSRDYSACLNGDTNLSPVTLPVTLRADYSSWLFKSVDFGWCAYF